MPTLLNSILFDLDGTLTDPAEGVFSSLLYAMEKLGRTPCSRDELRWCIGPPLQEVIAKIAGTSDPVQVQRGVDFYRERYGQGGMYENRVYDGVPELLRGLRERGLRLFVATAKPHVYAIPILERFGLSGYFKAIYGSELDGTRTDKAHLIAHILERETLRPEETLMIGDRKYDVLGARANGLKCISVSWGHGSREELEAAGTDFVCHAPEEVLARVLTCHTDLPALT